MRLRLFSRSLAARLTLVSVIGILVGLTLVDAGLIAAQLYEAARSEPHSWSYLGAQTAHQLVVKSLVRTEEGIVEIRPVPDLRRLTADMPNLRYAVFDRSTGVALRGSTAGLTLPLQFSNSLKSVSIDFLSPEKGTENASEATATTANTPIGPYVVAVAGFGFRWPDVFFDFSSDLSRLAPQLIPIILIVIGFLWFGLRRSMAPLRKVAQQAREIDLRSLDQRLPENEVPTEIEPFVSAVNNALTSLEAGIQRERRFGANAAHELRTPIAILIALVETMPNDAVSTELKRHLSQLQSIVEQLLASARIARSPSQAADIVDLAATVFSKVSDYTPLVMENGRDIMFEGPSSGVMTRGNIRAIESIVGNLLDNALRAEPPGGSVLASVSRDVTVSIIDHGEGVSAEDREKIFEPFWRKDENTVGTGLGLAIARELIEKLGGRIWVDDTPGGGATFRLSFPELDKS